jgi:hypothetical protein
MSTYSNEPPFSDLEQRGNIKLNYSIRVYFSAMETVLFAKAGAEVFRDELGFEWIKFVATNGPAAGKEHIVHAAEVVLVREDS